MLAISFDSPPRGRCRAREKPRGATLEEKRESIKEAAQHAWDAYEKYAWGYDELQPLTCTGRNTFGALGATLIDSLSTLWLMGMHDEFDRSAPSPSVIYHQSNCSCRPLSSL